MRITSLGYSPVNQSNQNNKKTQQNPAFEASRLRLFPVQRESGTFVGLVQEIITKLRGETDVFTSAQVVGGRNAQVELSLAADRKVIEPHVKTLLGGKEEEIAGVLTD